MHGFGGARETGSRSVFRSSAIAGFLVMLLVTLLAGAMPAGAQDLIPTINDIYPSMGRVGTPVAINGVNFGVVQLDSNVTFNGVEATPLTWSDALIITTVPDGASPGPVVVTTAAGSSNGVNFEVLSPIEGQTWFLAEGSTAWGYDTYVLMANTTDEQATVNVVYNTQQYGSIPRPRPITVPANSRTTLHLNDDIPSVDVSTIITSSQPIVCERAMYWKDRIDGHDSIGVLEPSDTWYMAEGCTDHGFETWVLVQNPQATDANVRATYMTSKGIVKADYVVAPGQRYSINVGEEVGHCDVSTMIECDQNVVCERAMYWEGRRGGHDSRGVTSPNPAWYLAEGTTAWGYETWLLVQNPSDSFAAVDVTYMTAYGPLQQPQFRMAPNSRKTVRVSDYVQNADTSIEVSSDQGVIAERAMYWNNGTGTAGHNTVGVTAPTEDVFLAEGSTAWGFDTYVCIQNPNDEDVDVDISYLTSDGALAGPARRVPANSRVTVYVNGDLPNMDLSTRLVADSPINAERAMYWHQKGGGHCSIGWMDWSE